MGFLSKVGKAVKKAVKDVGKVVKPALDMNPLLPGSSAQKALSSVAKTGLAGASSVLPLFGAQGAAALGVASSTQAYALPTSSTGFLGLTGASLVDTLSQSVSNVIKAGEAKLACELLGNCSAVAPAPMKSLSPGVLSTSEPSNMQPMKTQTLVIVGVALAAAWFLFAKKS